MVHPDNASRLCILTILAMVSLTAAGYASPTAKQIQQCVNVRQQNRVALQKAAAKKKAEYEAWSKKVADLEREGDIEANAGRLLEAELKYAEALKELDFEDNAYTRLFDKLVKLAATVPGGLEAPPEAVRFLKRGMAMIKTAGTQDDFGKAESEMNRAVEAAPWWGDAYFNRGLIREKMGHLMDAIDDFKIYLRASPGAKDAGDVENKIVTLEVQAEKSDGSRSLNKKHRQPASTPQLDEGQGLDGGEDSEFCSKQPTPDYWGIGLINSGVAVKYLAENHAWELKAQSGSGVMAAGPRYYYFVSDSKLRLFWGLEADFISFKGETSKGSGFAGGGFAGGDLAITENLGLAMDYGPMFISLTEPDYSQSESGVEYVVNVGFYWYFR